MVRRYLDTGDAKSTGNLRKHAKNCWGEDVVAAADETKDVHAAREALGKMKSVDSSITAAFERVAKSKVTYSHRQHTTAEARYALVHVFFHQLILGSPARKLFAGSRRVKGPSKSSTIVVSSL